MSDYFEKLEIRRFQVLVLLWAFYSGGKFADVLSRPGFDWGPCLNKERMAE